MPYFNISKLAAWHKKKKKQKQTDLVFPASLLISLPHTSLSRTWKDCQHVQNSKIIRVKFSRYLLCVPPALP